VHVSFSSRNEQSSCAVTDGAVDAATAATARQAASDEMILGALFT